MKVVSLHRSVFLLPRLILLLLALSCGHGENSGGSNGDGSSGLDARPANTTCLAGPPSPPLAGGDVEVEEVFTSLASFASPVRMLQQPGDDTRWFVVEKSGIVRMFDNVPGVATKQTFVDIRTRVRSSDYERGLLGMAFHPLFASNGYVFLSYTCQATADGCPANGASVISRFELFDSSFALDPDSEKIILTLPQPFNNHNGGMIEFSPIDGFLYIAFGDGGSGGDPSCNGSNPNTLLGSILRIDIDVGALDDYDIPADNPYANGMLAAPETFAWGLRNPWKFSFDRATGDLWLADVGQGLWEEVDLIESGKNYGWNFNEGAHFYSNACASPHPSLPAATDPLAEYGHDLGRSITGGYVYRGSDLPLLTGQYVYGDFLTGRIWGLDTDTYATEILIDNSGLSISSFAEGNDGEIYLLDYASGGIYQIVDSAGGGGVGFFPQALLSDTGCVDPVDPTQAASGMIPYDINVPFWSDGAVKSRWLSLPDGATITVGTDGDWEFPAGSVLMKEFRLNGELFETRLFALHTDGTWAGYSYEWNVAGTDANLLFVSKTKDIGGQSWTYPSRSQCLQCHTNAAGGSLGLETQQLNRDHTYPGPRIANQITTFEHIELFTDPMLDDPEDLPVLPPTDGGGTTAEIARAYLHVNCSQCHRPGGGGLGNADLRFATEEVDLGVCDEVPTQGDLGIVDARVVAPGDPARSVLLSRMLVDDVDRMPPIGRSVVDTEGAALIDAWIDELTGCP